MIILTNIYEFITFYCYTKKKTDEIIIKIDIILTMRTNNKSL